MDTLMIICDSVATCMNKTAGTCQPVVETNKCDNDVIIAAFICATILIIVLYGLYKYFKLKTDERNALTNTEKEKREQEEKARIEEQKKKLQSDLLSYLKEKAGAKKDNGKEISVQEFEDIYTKTIKEITGQLTPNKNEQKS